MHQIQTGRTRRGGPARGFAALVAAALVGLGLATSAPAQAAPAPPRPGPLIAKARQVKTGTPTVKPMCPAPTPTRDTCLSVRRTDVSSVKGLLVGADDAPVGYGPADLRGAYDLPADGGSGATVAIVDAQDDPNAEADLALYRQQYGLPPCTSASGCFRKVDQRGGTGYPVADPQWAGEISLDLDMVSAVAPEAHILLVEADSAYPDDLGASVDTAVALGAKFVSNSYGGFEDPAELASDSKYYDHPGVAVVASSGDEDYGVQYPAASPYVTSVGGTSLVRDSSARGWSESVWLNQWGGPGSGCSAYEPKPAFQKDTGCANRTVADVSAVADPLTGVAVYDTYQNGGWFLSGGTSVAAPIITSIYADAGTPAAASHPNAYPYQNPSALNDVTQGSNGGCSPAYLCTAGPGYDGPTGLGTPHGLTAFDSGPRGEVTGTVTDAGTGRPIAGATVSAGSVDATTGPDGSYQLSLPPGTYSVSAAAYGYTGRTGSVTVTDGGKVTESLALTALPTATISGRLSDGSGHGYPLYAQITVDGVPGGPVYSDPYTGRYQLALPRGGVYHLHVTAEYPGYQPTESDVTLGTADITDNVALPVDTAACSAPGYARQTISGKKACAAVTGGLVAGTVTDRNTGTGIEGATVTSDDATGTSAESLPATGDPNVGAGFYWLFSGLTGDHQFTAARSHYTSASTTVDVVANVIAKANLTLAAGRLAITPASVSKTVAQGSTATATLTVKNTGSQPATVRFGEAGATPPASAWTRIADYPTPIQDNAVGENNGVVYSVGGWSGFLSGGMVATMYSYDPAQGGWTQRASAPAPREGAGGAFIGGRFYVAGGWDSNDQTDGELDVYDPASDTWSTGAREPNPLARPGTAVLDGKLYLIGGCPVGSCGATVEVYDPASDRWSSAAPYPSKVSGPACGAIGGEIYCSGGDSGTAMLTHAYVYDPVGNAWSALPDPPLGQSFASSTVANGELIVSGGATSDGAPSTNLTYAYDPVTASWTRLPNALDTLSYSGGTLGFYRVGGNAGVGGDPVSAVEVLAGYNQETGDVPWLSEGTGQLTLDPGGSAKVTVTLDATDPSVAQYGGYAASITALTDTPYPVPAVGVSMRVTPPKGFGQITGTVTGDDGKGNVVPLANATVQINATAASYTLRTDSSGGYALWLDARGKPAHLIVARDGYRPRDLTVKLVKGRTVTTDVTLTSD